jgi:hypothetical protein
MDLQFFHSICPNKPLTEEKYDHQTVSYEDYITAWSEHDSIHYLLNLQFDVIGERKVAYVEQHCKVGYFQNKLSKRFNGYRQSKIIFNLPRGFGRKKIIECAELLRELYD